MPGRVTFLTPMEPMKTPEANRKYLSKHKSIWIENKWYRLLKEEAEREKRTTKKMINYILAERYER